MGNLITTAASLMSGGDDLRVERDSETGEVWGVHWHDSGLPVEYMRGMVELIRDTLGLAGVDGSRGIIYEAILGQITDTRIHDI